MLVYGFFTWDAGCKGFRWALKRFPCKLSLYLLQ